MVFQISKGTENNIYQDALMIRKKVFIKEQGVSESIEIDQHDNHTHHIVGYIDGLPLATARLYPLDSQSLKIQRVAVLKESRGQGLGKKLMLDIERWAKENHFNLLVLSAQDPVIPFYESIGYSISQEKGYLEAGIPHHDMQKSIL